MIRTCVTCGVETILGHEIDGALRVVDATPTGGAGAVLKGDPTDQPTVIWGVENEADAAWFNVDPASPRYRQHECETAVGR